jgi:hypothetical protein
MQYTLFHLHKQYSVCCDITFWRLFQINGLLPLLVAHNELIPHHTISFSLCSGLSCNWCGVWYDHYHMYCFLTWPYKWKWALTENSDIQEILVIIQNFQKLLAKLMPCYWAFINCWRTWILYRSSGLDAIFSALFCQKY